MCRVPIMILTDILQDSVLAPQSTASVKGLFRQYRCLISPCVLQIRCTARTTV